ncbi:MAG: iron-sulfur cluster assembly protein [Bacteroidia bacterium]|nr:iron-sulfur cluster assembly protein [Bacteroidia bacterium]
MNEELQKLQDKIVVMLRTVYDPEIPVNIYDLGLIYDVDIDDANNVTVEMTFTSPSCPAADFILMDVQMKVESIPEVNSVDLNLTFEPPWDKSMMSEEALLELGFM